MPQAQLFDNGGVQFIAHNADVRIGVQPDANYFHPHIRKKLRRRAGACYGGQVAAQEFVLQLAGTFNGFTSINQCPFHTKNHTHLENHIAKSMAMMRLKSLLYWRVIRKWCFTSQE
jgi:hypothetical protein